MGENAEIFERLSRIEQIVARIDERTKAHDSAHWSVIMTSGRA